jgi:hypothetical protein
MTKEQLTISLNEVIFFFTRAGFGLKVPVGVAEDFARSNVWIAENGFDPSLCSLGALDNIECQASDLEILFKKTEHGGRFYCPSNLYLSSIIASVSVVDRINLGIEDNQLVMKNVDFPILVIAAMGANKCNGLQVFWLDEGNHEYSVRFAAEGVWEVVSSNSQSIELSKGADMIIQPVDSEITRPSNAKVKRYTTANEKEKILQNGVRVGEKWQGIYDYFSRCLVKSTAESRASGAGAGMVDTD